MLFADRQARRGAHGAVGQRQERARSTASTLGRKPVGGIFSVGVEERVPLEGLGAERGRDPPVGRGRRRQRACGRGSRSSPARCTTRAGSRRSRSVYTAGATAHERYLRNERPLARVGAGLLAADRVVLRRRARAASGSRTTTLGLVPGARRGAHPVRDGPRPAAGRRDDLATLQALVLPNVAALSDRAVRASSRVRGAGRRPRGDARDLALRRVGRARQRLRPRGPLRRRRSRAAGRGRCRTPTCASSTSRPGSTRCWPGSRTRRGSSTARGRLDVKATQQFPNPPAHADPVLSRPADGEGLPAREPRTDVPQVYLREMGAGRVSSTSRGTSIARSGRCCPSTTAEAAAQRRRVGHERGPAGEVAGPGVLDVTVWRQRESMTVHLVNLTNPMMMKGPVREFVPVGEQRVRVRLPEGRAGHAAPPPRRGDGPPGPAVGRMAGGHGAVDPRPRGGRGRPLTTQNLRWASRPFPSNDANPLI